MESCGTDLPSFEPMFAIIGPKVQKPRVMYKENPRRFEVLKENQIEKKIFERPVL